MKSNSSEKPKVISMVQKIGGACNAYLIKGKDDKYVLIDSLLAGGKDLVMDAIKDKEIEYHIITHAHPDHYGNSKLVMEQNKNCKIVAHEKALETMKTGDSSQSKGVGFFFSIIFNIVTYFGGANKEIAVEITEQNSVAIETNEENDDIKMKEDDQKRLMENYGIEIVYTPGHTLDSISVLRREAGEMFVGDLMKGSSKKVDYFLLILDREKVNRSCKKIVELNPKSVFASHISEEVSTEAIKECFSKEYNNL